MKKYIILFTISILSCYMIGCTVESKDKKNSGDNESLKNFTLSCRGNDSENNVINQDITIVDNKVTRVLITINYSNANTAIINEELLKDSVGIKNLNRVENVIMYNNSYDRLLDLSFSEVNDVMNSEKELYNWVCNK